MDIQELETKVGVILNSFFVSYKKTNVLRGMSVQFIVEDFGLVVSCIQRMDYTLVDGALRTDFADWRKVFIATTDNLNESRYEILWALMRNGYMKWLRMTYPRQIKNTLLGTEELGRKIIEERLRLWGDKPKYNFLIEDNKFALANGVYQEITRDPGFFDYMPEI